MRKQGKEGLAIIVDNLARIPSASFMARSNHDALCIEHGEQLRSLRCHLVYTVSIASLYSKNVKVLTGIFPECRVLPMIKTHICVPAEPNPQSYAAAHHRFRVVDHW